MSQRFRSFVTRVAKDNEFNPMKNKLLNFLEKEGEHKYKNYPRLLEMMRVHWPRYRDGSQIAYLLKNHHEEIFYFYLNTLFPFRKRGLKFEDPESPTPVDFKLVYIYHYNTKEIEAIENVMKELNIDLKLQGVLKRLLIFAISAFGPMVEKIFERPFAFQFSSIDAEPLNGGWEVKAVISAREQ